MDIEVKHEIVAVVTHEPERVRGGVPVFVVHDAAERDRVAAALSVILRAVAHDLGNGHVILVKH